MNEGLFPDPREWRGPSFRPDPMAKTVSEVYADYQRWQEEDTSRSNVSFEEYLKTEVCN